jgi:hypothetical protein
MIRRRLSTVSAVAVVALGAAAPAVACNQQSGTTSPQAQQERARFADQGFLRRHHRHHRRFEQQAQSATQQSSPATQQQQDQQQGGDCHHGGAQD